MLLRGADVGSLLADEFGETEESDAVCLVRAANIVRRNLAEHLFTFEGSFDHIVIKCLFQLPYLH